MKVLGRTTVNMYIDDVEIELSCYVIDRLVASIIMGMDMLTQWKCKADFTRNEFSLLDGQLSVPLTSMARGLTVGCLKEVEWLKPRSEREITFRVPRRMNQRRNTVYVMANQKVIPDLGVASAI